MTNHDPSANPHGSSPKDHNAPAGPAPDSRPAPQHELIWDHLPKGIIGWVLWSLPRRSWRPILWGLATFIAVTGLVAFFQLLTLRQSEIARIRTDVFKEQWERSESPEWKAMLLRTWEPSEIPTDIWRKAANHHSYLVRQALVSHPFAPQELLSILLDKEKNPVVRVQAILNPKSGVDVFEALVNETDIGIVKTLARHPGTPPDLLQVVADRENDYRVQAALASNSSTPEPVLRELARYHSYRYAEELASNPALPADVLEKMVEAKTSSSYRIVSVTDWRLEAALRSAIGIQVLKKWSRKEELQRIAAIHPRTPPEVLQYLFEVEDNRCFIARNTSIPKNLRAQLIENGCPNRIAQNPSTPEKILADLADHADHEVRAVWPRTDQPRGRSLED